MNRRLKRGVPFAAYAALLFNAALCVAPFIGARAISIAYGDDRPEYEPSSEALSATLRAMDARFAHLATSGDGSPREVWAQYVREELESGDNAGVRGFLLAAPAMLKGTDGESLKARLGVANGGGDQALIDAALTYLPEDVQESYEKHNTPIVSMFQNSAAAAPEDAEPDDQLAREDTPQEYRVLGDLRDLARTAANWVHEARIDEFSFTLAGLGLTLADPESQEGASLALSARRAQRLDPKFETYLQRKLYAAAPPARIKHALGGEFQGEYGYVANTPVIQRVFQTTVDRGALESLESDLRVIRDISHETSPISTVALLSTVKDGSDLRRARLIAQAGGDRAVALARYDGENFLDSARTVIHWSNGLRLQLLGLFACLALLGAIAANVAWRSFRRNATRRRSAVYALDEVPGLT
ncbi:MAG: hypothetical protein GC155_15245 [Alphaproteobacteria bacterium]|nr:hypothetical protein [Alphaproteobacteria bacterium]